MLSSYMKQFGRDSFALVTLLVFWFGIALPEINRNSVRTDDLRVVSQQVVEAAETLKATAESMERTTQRIDNLIARRFE